MSAGRACHKLSCKSLGMSSRSSTDADMSRLGKLLRDINGIPVFFIGVGLTLMSAASPLPKQGAGPGEDVLPVTRHAGKVDINRGDTADYAQHSYYPTSTVADEYLECIDHRKAFSVGCIG